MGNGRISQCWSERLFVSLQMFLPLIVKILSTPHPVPVCTQSVVGNLYSFL
jgi:hypothetical protein